MQVSVSLSPSLPPPSFSLPPSLRHVFTFRYCILAADGRARAGAVHLPRLVKLHLDRFYEPLNDGLADIMKAINLHASDFPIALYEKSGGWASPQLLPKTTGRS